MRQKNKHKRTTPINGVNNKSNWVLHFVRVLVALVFIFSGFVKAVDPLGTVYKIEDYLIAFGGIFHFFLFASFPLAIILITLELLIGLNLLFQIKLKWNLWAVLAFTLIMAGLTLYIAIYNPVEDCGCFGDAIIIENWPTFYKNIAFLILIIILLIFQNRFKVIFSPRIEWGVMCIFLLLSFGFMSYNLMNLPVIDFRPYKKGVNIAEGMIIPDGAPTDIYEYFFEYEKNGYVQEFAIDALPDSTWTYVDTRTVLVSKGYQPPIQDFEISSLDGVDMTNTILSYEGITVFILMYDLRKTSKKAMQKVKIYLDKQDKNIKTYGLTASSSKEISAFKKLHNLHFPFYIMDSITLKTMVRANPGVMVLENGVIQGKWNGNKNMN